MGSMISCATALEIDRSVRMLTSSWKYSCVIVFSKFVLAHNGGCQWKQIWMVDVWTIAVCSVRSPIVACIASLNG